MESSVERIEDFATTMMELKTLTDLTSAFCELTNALTKINGLLNPVQVGTSIMKFQMMTDRLAIVEEEINDRCMCSFSRISSYSFNFLVNDYYDPIEEKKSADDMCSQILDSLGIKLNESV
jgi:hypothetical protein